MASSLRLKIFGVEYALRTDNEERTQRVANFVDTQMNTLRARNPEQPTSTLAVLTALNSAEMLIAEQDDRISDAEYVATELRALDGLLTRAIEG